MQQAARRGRADLHIHSRVGDGMASIRELLDFVEHCTDLDVIAITDHDDVRGGYQAQEYLAAKGYRFEVIVGAEVTTLSGHLLALFLERQVKGLQSLAKTIDDIHAQGGLAVVPHPMSWLTRSVGQRGLERLLNHDGRGSGVDGLETVNATIAGRVCADKVRRLNETRYHLAEIGGSDAHFLVQVGRGYTEFSGQTAADVRRGLENKTTTSHLNTELAPARLTGSEILRQQYRSLVFLPSQHIRRKVQKLWKGRD